MSRESGSCCRLGVLRAKMHACKTIAYGCQMGVKYRATKKIAELVSLETDTRFAITVDVGAGASYGKRWIIMFDEARQQVIRELRSASTLRVFLSLPDHLTWTEFRSLHQSELAAALEIDSASVSRAMRDLLARGIVERIGKGPVQRWKLSLAWGWRGSAAAYQSAVREAEKARLSAVPISAFIPLNAAEGILC